MRIEFDTDGIGDAGTLRDRMVRRLEAELGRVSAHLERVAVRVVDARDRDRPGCPGRDRFEGRVVVHGRDGEQFSLRGEGDDVESLVARLAGRVGRMARRRVGSADAAGRRARRHEVWR